MTLCLIMFVSPFVHLYVCLSLYRTVGLVMDFVKNYVGNFLYHVLIIGDHGSTVVQVSRYKSEGRCFNPR
jgi:hypothetical protein